MFEQISRAIIKQLTAIRDDDDEEDRGYITAKDFMNDFATEAFLSKNIRVRPTSGVTREQGGDDGKTENYNKSSNDPNAGQDKDEKDHQEFLLVLEEARRQAKEKR